VICGTRINGRKQRPKGDSDSRNIGGKRKKHTKVQVREEKYNGGYTVETKREEEKREKASRPKGRGYENESTGGRRSQERSESGHEQ